jgi:hypothetical protein
LSSRVGGGGPTEKEKKHRCREIRSSHSGWWEWVLGHFWEDTSRRQLPKWAWSWGTRSRLEVEICESRTNGW